VPCGPRLIVPEELREAITCNSELRFKLASNHWKDTIEYKRMKTSERRFKMIKVSKIFMPHP
jgi:hypothetical protein